ncbi:MAG: hypothetical protein K2M11_03350 [Paramuribaculum sp.]|nr:hypothetical protein [Paramuribaculum sp.]
MNCKIVYQLSAVFLLCLGSGCSGKPDNTGWQNYSRDRIESIINQPVKMPDSIPVCYPDSDAYYRLMDSETKVIFCVDISCAVCLSKFNYWNEFSKRIEEEHGLNVPILAVIFSPEFNDDIKEYINRQWSHEWIYDPEQDFTFYNNIEDDRFQAVLLDANDTIRLVGNPVMNEALGKLYEKTVIERLR